MGTDPKTREQALEWAVRTGDPGFSDWEAFAAWLEEDSANASAYDRIVAAVADVAEAGLPEAARQAVTMRHRTARWRAWAPALAASVALAIGIGLWSQAGGTETYLTQPGEMRQIALADGSTITLGGGSELEIDDANTRAARLESGQALFTVRHDPARPFTVKVGEDTLVDAGTVFDVRRAAGVTSVAVSEGEVIYNPATHRHRLLPGDRATRRDGARELETERIPVSLIGEWREGRLTFRNASLADVTADLTRASGIGFTAAPGAAERRISGSVVVAPIRQDPASLGPILGVSVERRGKDWVIAP